MNDCCQKSENLRPVNPERRSTSWSFGPSSSVQCQVCGLKHYSLKAEPMRLDFKPLGG